MDNIASSSTGPAKFNNGRRRHKRQALVILEDYFKVSQSPSQIEKEALLEKIKALPEYGDYEMGTLTNWFTNRRRRLRLKEKEQKARALHSTNDSRFPSLTPTAIQHLTVLASNQLHPSSELLKTWATLLASSGANEQDVTNWIHYRNKEQQLQHLPTPSDTTMTPEPSASPTQSTFPLYKQESTTPPLMLTLQQLHPYEHTRSTPSEPTPTLLPASNNDPKLVLNQRPQVPGLQAIIHGVRAALENPQTTPNTAPRTAAEFEAMFFPFEQQILLLIHALED